MASRLQTLKPRVQPLQSRQASAIASGDVRIRGNSLQAIRRRIFERDCGLCVCPRCKVQDAVRAASIVDHVTPLWAGGQESDDNRQSISVECHDLKSAHEAKCRARGAFVPWDGSDA